MSAREGYVRDPASTDDYRIEMWHLDGIDWYHAPKPRRWHKCWAQTYGYTNYFDGVERCACGSIRRMGTKRWYERNGRSA